MRIESLQIDEFKNLRRLSVSFDKASPYAVLVGENGSGKSNLIEALSLIFRNLDLDQEAPFSYEIVYNIRNYDVSVIAQKDQYPKFSVRSDTNEIFSDIPRKRFMALDNDGRPLFRPAFVFGYYSGPSDRLASIFEKHRERYYSWIIRPASRRTKHHLDPNSLRRAFYAQTLHGQFALIAFFMEAGATDTDGDRQFLREHLNIDGLDSILLALKRPPWNRKGGDTRFWGAEGEVQQFLSRIYDRALLPIRMKRRIAVDLTKNPSVENLYLFLPDPEVLSQIYQSYGNQYAFFTALESMHLSKLLAEVRTRVRLAPRAGGGKVTYRDLRSLIEFSFPTYRG